MQTTIADPQYQLGAADLELLLALHRGRTLAGAGERLGIDASTVFRQLQRIEKGLGLRLFERGRTGYSAGDAALDLLAHAERAESAVEAARAALARPHGPVTGKVSLSTTDSVLRGLVLPCLPALAAEHPGLQLELRTGNELVSLTRRDADLALRATPRPPQHLVGRHLGTIRFVPCAARSQARRLRRQPLDQLPWVGPDDGMPDHPTVQWRRRQLPKVVPRVALGGIVAVADAVKCGLGVAALPQFLLPVEPGLAAIGEPLAGCESQLWLLAHPESRHLRRIAVVFQHLAEGIRLEPAAGARNSQAGGP